MKLLALVLAAVIGIRKLATKFQTVEATVTILGDRPKYEVFELQDLNSGRTTIPYKKLLSIKNAGKTCLIRKIN